MAQVLVRELPENVTQTLKDLAKREGVSFEEKLRRILQRAAVESATHFKLPVPVESGLPVGMTVSELLVRDRR